MSQFTSLANAVLSVNMVGPADFTPLANTSWLLPLPALVSILNSTPFMRRFSDMLRLPMMSNEYAGSGSGLFIPTCRFPSLFPILALSLSPILAPSPIAMLPVMVSLPTSTSAECPMNMLFDPLVSDLPLSFPTATFSEPVVTSTRAPLPTATFSIPVALAIRAESPSAVLSFPEVRAADELAPMETFWIPEEVRAADDPAPTPTFPAPTVPVFVMKILLLLTVSATRTVPITSISAPGSVRPTPSRPFFENTNWLVSASHVVPSVPSNVLMKTLGARRRMLSESAVDVSVPTSVPLEMRSSL